MSVQDIAYYRQQDGRDILKVTFKPTKNFPNGGAYVDAYFEELITNYSWYLKRNDYIEATVGAYSWDDRVHFKLHQEIAFQCLNYYPDYLDHFSGLKIDNVTSNLEEVTSQQNNRNVQKRGYDIKSAFIPRVKLDYKNIYQKGSKKEDTACLNQFQLESKYYSDYNYDFLADRRNDLDIVELERTGKISSEEATFQHVMRYAKENAW